MTNQWDTYAALVDDRIGSGGDDLHTKLIDPLILSYIGNPKAKDVIDLGCGNGYLFGKLPGLSSYTGVDSSEKLLGYAKKRLPKRSDVTLLQSDIAGPLSLPDAGADLCIANMSLQYVPSLENIPAEIFRLLRPGGVFILIVDHPGHALFARAQELAGKPNEKFINFGSYFNEGVRQKNSLWNKAVLSYYHRTTASYLNAFSGFFTAEHMDELTKDGETPRILGIKFVKE
jgi:SAM-dependent methyltransferase